MMKTEVLLLSCLVAIPICNSIPVNVMAVPLNGIDLEVQSTSSHPSVNSKSLASSNDVAATVQEGNNHVTLTHYNDITSDYETDNKTEIGSDVTSTDAGTNDQTVQRVINSITNSQQRAAGLCSNLNQEQEHLCRHSVIANSMLDELFKLLNNLIKDRLYPLTLQLTSQEANGDCTMNVTRLNSDLDTAITAVCLLGNVTETTEVIGGCCHSDSHIMAEFKQFTNFLQTNIFRLLVSDLNMDAVQPICLEKNINVIWLVRHINNTLQNVKQLVTSIESRQCFIN